MKIKKDKKIIFLCNNIMKKVTKIAKNNYDINKSISSMNIPFFPIPFSFPFPYYKNLTKDDNDNDNNNGSDR